jgi:hypothetical protein
MAISALASFSGPILSTLRQNALAILAVLIFCWYAQTLITRRFFYLGNIPGPWWACYTRIWLFKTLASEDSPNRYIETNEKYG